LIVSARSTKARLRGRNPATGGQHRRADGQCDRGTAGQSLEIHDQPPFAVGQNPMINNNPPQVMKRSYAPALG
jgi:hypothetical protein